MWINNVLIVTCVLYVQFCKCICISLGNFPISRWERTIEITTSIAIVYAFHWKFSRGLQKLLEVLQLFMQYAFHWEFSSFKMEKDYRNKSNTTRTSFTSIG